MPDAPAEGEAGFAMVRDLAGTHRVLVAGVQGDDDAGFVDSLRSVNATPHVAQKQRSVIDARTTRHAGDAISQRTRKHVEEVFGWLKLVRLRTLRAAAACARAGDE